MNSDNLKQYYELTADEQFEFNQNLTLEQRLYGLMLIIQDSKFSEDSVIHCDYLLEKIPRCIDGSMIFHPKILQAIYSNIYYGIYHL